jgi:hypothetical protein
MFWCWLYLREQNKYHYKYLNIKLLLQLLLNGFKKKKLGLNSFKVFLNDWLHNHIFASTKNCFFFVLQTFFIFFKTEIHTYTIQKCIVQNYTADKSPQPTPAPPTLPDSHFTKWGIEELVPICY